TLTHYNFTDNHNGTGRLVYRPNFYDSGVDTINFLATDFGTPQRTTTAISQVTTNEVNQPPVITPLGPFTVVVDDSLIFTVQAADSTDPISSHRVILSTLGLPANAAFADNGNNTGRFAFHPNSSQIGLNQVTFLGVDQGTPQLSTTLMVNISVVTVNLPPVLAPIGPRTIVEGQTLTISLSASDPDGPAPALQMTGAPDGSTLVDNGNGTGVFTYTPGYLGHQRLVSVTIRAFDGLAIDKELVLIQVYDAGNQRPYFDSIPTPSIVEGMTIIQGLTATDPDGDPLVLSIDAAQPLPTHASFLDLTAGGIEGRAAGAITFAPDFTQSGTHDIFVLVSDGTLADTIMVTFTVVEFGNHAPTIAAIADQTVAENATLTVTVTVSDLDGDAITLSAESLPTNATFVDNGDRTGTFTFHPDYNQAGPYAVTFRASDGTVEATLTVNITVTDTNRLPFVFTDVNVIIYEGDTLSYPVTSFDADGTMPFLSARLSGVDTLARNMTFTDPRDGTGMLVFRPSYTQGGPSSNATRYYVVFRAVDEVYPTVFQNSDPVMISVIDRNQPPDIVFPFYGGAGPHTINEGQIVSFIVGVLDGDAVAAPSLRAENMPAANATFSYDPLTRSGQFLFHPDFLQSGAYAVRFIATDDRNGVDTAIVEINVLDAGNQPPSFLGGLPDTLAVPTGHPYQILVRPSDPEHDSITVEVTPMLPGASWQPQTDGSWLYTFTANSSEIGSVYRLTFVVTDYPGLATDTLVVCPRVVAFLRGDVDSDNVFSVNDVAYLVEFLYRSGQAPAIMESADIDNSGTVTISDVSYLIYYMFRNGPPPAP
ncbi:MAG: tandem-95 repeat protein, partial [candidate division Zixibacteria bacterium]|nr:tandem-95 repeat protein [candidate division Zixibacteria bacterium]